MKNVKIIWVSILLMGFLSFIGCGKKMQPMPSEPEVAIINIQPQPQELVTELPGRTSAYRIAEIRPQVNGIIQKRLFTEGADVNCGQVLYQIEPAPFQAAVNNAKASLARSEATLPSIQLRVERYKELLEDKAVSQQEYDDATSALNQAQADIQYWKAMLDTAQINLSYTSVTAPISGRIGKSTVTDGALVTAYQPVALATIQQLNPIYVDVPQSTTEMLRLNRHLRNGKLNKNENQNKVKLFLEDGTEYPLMGTLQFRDITVDQTTASVTYRVVFENPDNILLPGMFMRVLVVEGVQEQAILIPQQAVSRDTKGNPIALIVDEDKKVQPRMLVLDRAIGDQWLVTSGLEAGDRLIVEGIQKVRPGAVVKTVLYKPNKEVVKKTNEAKQTVEGE
ncbi:MAG: efflux RND transporter periplasmic adaptor subunit [Phycisphaerales bacterium]